MQAQKSAQFAEYLRRVGEILSSYAQMGGRSRFAVNAIERTCLRRDNIDSKGSSKSP
jgi:hypothetical protein